MCNFDVSGVFLGDFGGGVIFVVIERGVLGFWVDIVDGCVIVEMVLEKG